MGMALAGFNKPLDLIVTGARLLEQAENELGVTVNVSTDFETFAKTREWVRGSKPWPYLDPKLNNFNPTNAFWIEALQNDETVFLHGFRYDYVAEDFSHWCRTWVSGLHARAGETVKIEEPSGTTSERVVNLRGGLCHQAELWVGGSGHKFKWRALDILPRLGLILAYIQWQPEAIWALVDPKDVARGGVYRAGNPHIEPDFLIWETPAPGMDYDREALSTLTKSELEVMVSELSRTLNCRPEINKSEPALVASR